MTDYLDDNWQKESIKRVATKHIDERMNEGLRQIEALLKETGLDNMTIQLDHHQTVGLGAVLLNSDTRQQYSNYDMIYQDDIVQEAKRISDNIIEQESRLYRR